MIEALKKIVEAEKDEIHRQGGLHSTPIETLC